MNAGELLDSQSLFLRQWIHDLRSPLSALAVVTDRLQQQGAQEAEILAAALQRLQSLSGDMNPLGASDASVTLPTALQNLFLEKRTEYAQRSGVDFQFLNLMAETVKVSLPPSLFQRMISNLINNSVEAIEGNGWVRVKVWRDHGDLYIEIADTGRGIPPAVLSRVTDCGFSYGKDGGTGLGLWQAWQAAKSVGGALIVDSIWGEGTTVQVRLPIESQEYASLG
ncbi:MAG: sensor histidine kinase [Bdellovibrionaceae bacterium]|nr:sensor histidine kinase [Bdellovibrionales bacterium]MCB9083465.1 sensor histidine kinase [Pseudobdellovibrionaceae bacterium]